MSFPPKLKNMRDVVINQEAQEQLALRKGSSSLVIPNVFDFDNPPDPTDEYASDVRNELGLEEDDFLFCNRLVLFLERNRAGNQVG